MPDNTDTDLISSLDSKHELSSIIIPLLKGIIYRDENPGLWGSLLNQQAGVRDYVTVLGLELMLDEAEGYGYLRSSDNINDDSTPDIPRLIVRRQLSFKVSLVLALLRKKLTEFDAGGGDSRLILSKDEIVEIVRIFLPSGSNEAKIIDEIGTILNKISELGFIRRLRGQTEMIEVRRIIKAFVDAQWLADFDIRLAEYRKQLEKKKDGVDV